MVNAKKHNNATAENDVESGEIPEHLKYFFSIYNLGDEIIEYAEKEFGKKFDDLDVMNVAIFTLHGIVFAETDAEKEIRKKMLCEMVDDKYNLNEWLFSRARELKAYNETFYECLKTGNTDDLDAKLDKAVEEANYKAWHEELAIIKKDAKNGVNRKNKINGGA